MPATQRPTNERLREILKRVYDPDPIWRERAIKDLVHESLAQERALSFYADPHNWIDGVPYVQAENGVLEGPDLGFEARWQMHLCDVIAGPYIVFTKDYVDNLCPPFKREAETVPEFPVWQAPEPIPEEQN